MTEELTPSQSLLVWCVLANQGVAKQKDVVPAVKKADRETLVRAKLLDVTKQGNSFLLRLEDDGWAWAVAHLRANLPPAYNVLQGFLIRLDEHLRKADITLADFIGPAPELP